jgi:hypothetical protein
MPVFLETNSPHASLAPSFAYQKTFSSHLAQKRSLQSSAIESYSQLKPTFELLQSAQARGEIISSTPPGLALSISSKTINHQIKEETVRALILQNWGAIASQWGETSGQEMSIYCTGPSLAGLPDPAPPNQNQFFANKLFGACDSQITLREDFASNKTILIINPGVFVLTTNRATNQSALSPLVNFEVD